MDRAGVGRTAHSILSCPASCQEDRQRSFSLCERTSVLEAFRASRAIELKLEPETLEDNIRVCHPSRSSIVRLPSPGSLLAPWASKKNVRPASQGARENLLGSGQCYSGSSGSARRSVWLCRQEPLPGCFLCLHRGFYPECVLRVSLEVRRGSRGRRREPTAPEGFVANQGKQASRDQPWTVRCGSTTPPSGRYTTCSTLSAKSMRSWSPTHTR